MPQMGIQTVAFHEQNDVAKQDHATLQRGFCVRCGGVSGHRSTCCTSRKPVQLAE